MLKSLLGLQCWDWGQFRIFPYLFLGEKIKVLQGSISTPEAPLHWQNKLTNCSWIAEPLGSFEQFLKIYGSVLSIHLLFLHLFFWSFLINKIIGSKEQFQLSLSLPSLFYALRDLMKVEIRGILHNKASLKGLKCCKICSLAFRSNLELRRWVTKVFLSVAAGQIYSCNIVSPAGNKGTCSTIKVERTSRPWHVNQKPVSTFRAKWLQSCILLGWK